MLVERQKRMGNAHVQPARGFPRPSLTLRINNRGRRVMTRPDENDHRRVPTTAAATHFNHGLLTAGDRAELARRYAKRAAHRGV